MKRSHRVDFLKGVVLFSFYFVTAILGLQLDAVSGFATLVWLPTGISLAFLLIFGLRFWPAVMLGAFLANLLSDAPFLVAVGISIGNTLEALVGAYLLKRFVRFQPELDRVKDVLGLIFLAAIASTLISASIGVFSLWAGGVISGSATYSTWIAWWTGDMISNLVIAPLLLVWGARPYFNPGRRFVVELAGLAFALAAISLFIFSSIDFEDIWPRPYLIFPPLIWAAIRFGQRTAVGAVFFVSAIAVWYTAYGFGPFAEGSISKSLLGLNSFMGVMAATTMLLAAAINERKQLEKKKDEFIGVVSHELRTPLTTIKMLVQTAQRQLEKRQDAKSTGYLERIDGQVDKIAHLIMELLDATKIQQGKIVLNKTSFPIGALIQEVVDLVGSADRKIEVKGQLNTVIFADRDRVSQVITNLLTNAMKYSSRTKKIIIKVTGGSGYLTVCVQDFGDGVAKKEQQNIFNRFYRISDKDSKQTPSLGLGLYIAKEIIENHQGKIWVKSPSSPAGKRGSIFYFRLPIKH